MAGRHRGGTNAVMCRALLANDSFDDAERQILQRRKIEVSHSALTRKGGSGSCTLGARMASGSLVPRGDTDIQAAPLVLQLNFELHGTIAKELNTGVRNLEGFRFLFEDEVKIGAWVAKLSLGDATAIQTARLRRGWTACKVYFQLDSLLEDSELRDVKTQFCKRYRLRFPADAHPSDAVVSRVSRELSKRMLCVCSVSGKCAVSNFRWDPPSASAS